MKIVRTSIDYADDAVLFKESPGDWTTSFQKFEDEAGAMGLHTSWIKTRIRNVGSGSAPATITIVGQTVDSTDKVATAAQKGVSGWALPHPPWDSSESGEIRGYVHRQKYAFTLHAFGFCIRF